MRRRTALMPLAVLLLAPGSGCGLIVNGYRQDLRVDSVPQGARVFVSSTDTVHITPARIELRRGQDYTVYLRHDNFPDRTITLSACRDSSGYLRISSKSPLYPITHQIVWLITMPFWMVDMALGTDEGFCPDNVLIDLASGSVWTSDGDPPNGWPETP